MNDDEEIDPVQPDPGPYNSDHRVRMENSRKHASASASDQARVGQQIGLNEGTVYHAGDTYHISSEDPPERRQQVALELLSFNAPRQAEDILGALLSRDVPSMERVYYYVLSVLSGRSWHDLHGELAERVRYARRVSCKLERDSWSAALDVLWHLLDQVRQEAEANTADGYCSLDVHSQLAELPSDRQEEIITHLDALLDGARSDRLQADRVKQVVARRLGARRRDRACLFFEDEPTPPRRDIVRVQAPAAGEWALVFGGTVGFLGGLVLLEGSFGPVPALCAAGLLVAGYLLVRYGSERATCELIATAQRREAGAGNPEEPRSPGQWVRSDFVRDIHQRVDLRFKQIRPHLAGHWLADTEQARAILKKRLVDRYGNLRVKPTTLDWLIRWHATEAARQWRAHTVQPPEGVTEIQQRPTRASLAVWSGAMVATVSLLGLAVEGQLLAVLLLGPGGGCAVGALRSIRSTQALRRFLDARAARRHTEEMQAYREWVAVLAERPTDREMARWLAMDRIYLWIDAANRARLSAQEILAHVVILEGVQTSAQAQTGGGLRRYSVYRAQIFLLTRDGVREATAELDFLCGEVRDERRTSFRYDAVAAASVAERGVRTTRSDRQASFTVERLHSRTFRLTLLDGSDVAVIQETFRRGDLPPHINLAGWDDLAEGDSVGLGDADEPLHALQDSGTERALPLLESVAAEGAGWIARHQERRRRWAQDWPSERPSPADRQAPAGVR